MFPSNTPRYRYHVLGISLLTFGLATSALAQQAHTANLDPLVDIPSCFESLTPDTLESTFAAPGSLEKFKWLTSDRTRALFQKQPYSNHTINLSLFGGTVPIEEAVVDFTADGKYLGATISIYNRGDGGSITAEDFDARFKKTGSQLGERLSVRPFSRKANPRQGLLTEGYTWVSSSGMAVLEQNPEVKDGTIEFLRMRVMRRDAKGPLAAAMNSRSGASVKLSELARNVEKLDDGSVVITQVPMVDQGAKGYCVVASAQRIFEYYGIPCDMHQLAQIAGSDAASGTSNLAMVRGLEKIVHRFKTRFKIYCMTAGSGRLHEIERELTVGDVFEERDFGKEVRRSIDAGVPLLWSLELGQFPEEGRTPQVGGGHMRLIIGYNDKTGNLLFSDSWGAGHERKQINEAHAYRATRGLYALLPTTR